MKLPFDYRLVEKVEYVYSREVEEQLRQYDEQIKEIGQRYISNCSSHSPLQGKNLVDSFMNEIKPIEEAKAKLLATTVPSVRVTLKESATLY